MIFWQWDSSAPHPFPKHPLQTCISLMLLLIHLNRRWIRWAILGYQRNCRWHCCLQIIYLPHSRNCDVLSSATCELSSIPPPHQFVLQGISQEDSNQPLAYDLSQHGSNPRESQYDEEMFDSRDGHNHASQISVLSSPVVSSMPFPWATLSNIFLASETSGYLWYQRYLCTARYKYSFITR